MRVDLTRTTFRPHRGYSGVLVQQGRVQLDADANEATAIALHRDRVTSGDVIGACGAPRDSGAFAVSAAGGDLLLAPGRLYVDGILVDAAARSIAVTALSADTAMLAALTLDGRPLARCQWLALGASGDRRPIRVTDVDEATRTVSFAPALPDDDVDALAAAGPSVSRLASYTTQPYLPDPPLATGDCPVVDLTDGVWAAYLEVWERAVTHREDPHLREPALGGPDTTARSQVVWQLRLERLAEDPGAEVDCEVPPRPDPGALEARAQPTEAAADDCTVPAGAGYRRLENQLYRVEVAEAGVLDDASFVWSRENGSVVAAWLDSDERTLIVDSTGPDAARGFGPGDVVELADRTRELAGTPGTFVTVERVDEDGLHLAVDPPDRDDFDAHALVRRWDDRTGPRTVERPADDDGWLDLEDGVQIRFAETGTYAVGDYWLIPARTATADVDWPRHADDTPIARRPDGVARHRCVLALVRRDGDTLDVTDCRPLLPPLTDLRAGDVTVHPGVCDLPTGTTVQDTLETLCRQRDLRHHNKHLHGWGIVCGLQVVCAPATAEGRTHVTVRPGYAIDAEGTDVILEADEPVDVIAAVERLQGAPASQVSDDDVCLILEPHADGARHHIGVERYDPSRDTWQSRLDGTLLMDFYVGCVKPVEDFLREELATDDDVPAGPAHRLGAVLANLLTQAFSPQAGQDIFVSSREHDITRGFYDRLRALLTSETFCAMFAAARPLPDYPPEVTEDTFWPENMDTIFGRGHHTRLRLRPGHAEAYTVGGGINPLAPTTLINRYDLQRRELVATLDPIAGAGQADTDSGSGAVHDVAFSPDGDRIHMVATTRNGENTFFRSGRVAADTVHWGSLVTICGVRLVTLATTARDEFHVYAIGEGRGLYRIDPDDVDPSMEPLAAFNAAGHLRLTRDGQAVATSCAQTQPPRYDELRVFNLPEGQESASVTLELAGDDDIAVHQPLRRRRSNAVYCVTGPDEESGCKRIETYRLERGRLDFTAFTQIDDTVVSLDVLDPGREPLVLATSEDGNVLRMVTTDDPRAAADYELPLQAGPISIATDDDAGTAYVLNYLANTITVVSPEVLRPDYRFPFAALADYRKGALEALLDLAGGFLQYLKDCACHHLLVDCPEASGDEQIYLACVRVRDGQVHSVCNFSGRKYVKSFPTVGYWLSLVPVAPLARWLVEKFCCLILPDRVAEVDAPAAEAPDRGRCREHGGPLRTRTLRDGLATVQAADVPARSRQIRRNVRVASAFRGESLVEGFAAGAGRHMLDAAGLLGESGERAEAALSALGVAVEHLADEPTTRPGLLGMLSALLRPPQPGERVRLHERDERVRAVSVAPPAPDPQVEALARSLEERETEIARLREQVEELRAFRDEAAQFMRSREDRGQQDDR